MNSPSFSPPRQRAGNFLGRAMAAFTLVELLVVMLVILVLLGLTVPLVRGIFGNRNVSDSLDTISDYLTYARTQAMTQNTYTVVGFYQATDDLQIGSVISSNGLFDPTKVSTLPASYPPLGRIVHASNVMLATPSKNQLGSLTNKLQNAQATPDGKTIIDCVAESPSSSQSSTISFKSGSVIFYQCVIAFSPQGEALFFPQSDAKTAQNFSANLPFYSQLFIGLCSSRGGSPVPNDPNTAALTIDGGSGNIKLYRP